jgi:hypothetical protein
VLQLHPHRSVVRCEPVPHAASVLKAVALVRRFGGESRDGRRFAGEVEVQEKVAERQGVLFVAETERRNLQKGRQNSGRERQER